MDEDDQRIKDLFGSFTLFVIFSSIGIAMYFVTFIPDLISFAQMFIPVVCGSWLIFSIIVLRMKGLI